MVAPLLISKAPVSLPLGGARRSVQPVSSRYPAPAAFTSCSVYFWSPSSNSNFQRCSLGDYFWSLPGGTRLKCCWRGHYLPMHSAGGELTDSQDTCLSPSTCLPEQPCPSTVCIHWKFPLPCVKAGPQTRAKPLLTFGRGLPKPVPATRLQSRTATGPAQPLSCHHHLPKRMRKTQTLSRRPLLAPAHAETSSWLRWWCNEESFPPRAHTRLGQWVWLVKEELILSATH